MNRTVNVWIGWIGFFIFFTVLTNGCTAVSKGTPPTRTRETRTYTNREYKFSIAYPSDWIIENESYQLVILVPTAAQSWQPSVPSEISKDPHIELEMDGYIGERLGPANFPAVVDANNLRAWLEQKVRDGETRDLSELIIYNVQAFELTEIYEPNCERVVYWRPEGPESLVRISTGCESTYLTEFDQIVSTIRQVE